ncbi:MAG: mechanosensitive ion channel [Clostridiales bacterium]|nr:mechanosensitive ion channel [Clostridiales bacterium]
MEDFWNTVDSWFEGGAFSALFGTVCMVLLAAVLLFALRRIIAAIQRRMGERRGNLRFVHSILKFVIMAVTVMGILYQVKPLRVLMTSLLAGSGVVALFVGLASQQSLGNFVSGLLMSISHPFAEGDRVTLRDINLTAHVEQVSLMHSRFRTFQNSLVIIPNSVLDKMVIENSDMMGDAVSNYLDVPISPRADLNKAMEIISRIASAHPLCLDRRSEEDIAQGMPKASVRVTAMERTHLMLRCTVWSTTPGTGYEALCDIRRDVKLAFDEAGITLGEEQVVLHS